MEQNSSNGKQTHIAYSPEPDFDRPPLSIPTAIRTKLLARLESLYGATQARACLPELERLLKVHDAYKPAQLVDNDRAFVPGERFTQEDMLLITYGDLIQNHSPSSLHTLAMLARENLQAINTIHILPFFPSSSDKGFAIKDFETVDPNLGSWEDIEEFNRHYNLMFDGVFNHVSSKSHWFAEFLCGNPEYQDYFIFFRSPDELTHEQRLRITRPRTSDVLTQFQTIDGPVYVWTTFSADQVDLNFKNPKVLLRIIEIMLFYVRKGADFLRLDAVTYLWSEPGTSCASLEQTHEIVQLFRDILNLVAPRVAIVTETNVPHEENLSYFGDGYNEAHMIYNFALPPLVLYSIYTEDASVLSQWAAGLSKLSDTTHFLNFLDTHDGFGLLGVKDILSSQQIKTIIDRAVDHGGLISYRTDRDGNEIPYEINITLFSALNKDSDNEQLSLQVKRLMAARSVTLVLQGVPGIYLLGLMGKRNDIEAVTKSKSNRAINRTVLDANIIHEQLQDPDSKLVRIKVIARYTTERAKHRAFHPNGDQRILHLAPELFSVLRTSPEGDEQLLAITNMANGPVDAVINTDELGITANTWKDVLSDTQLSVDNGCCLLYTSPSPRD